MIYCLLFFIFFWCNASTIYFKRIPVFEAEDNLNIFYGANDPEDYLKKTTETRAFLKMKEIFKRGGCCLLAEELSDQSNPSDLVGVLYRDRFGLDDQTESYYPYHKRILMLWEPPLAYTNNFLQPDDHRFYSKVLTMIDDYIVLDDQKYVKYYYPQASLAMTGTIVPFEEKKLLTMVSTNKLYVHPMELYSQRKKVIDYFEAKGADEFDLYGIRWPTYLRNYKGTLANKVEGIKNYKFAICYENSHGMNGYISEKIFDCFKAGCVPIFWGVDNITDFIPPNCFIDRRNFANLDEIYTYIKNISQKEYNQYLSHIKAFLSSPAAFRFSIEYFVDTVARILIPSYDRRLFFSDKEIEMLKHVDLLEESHFLSLKNCQQAIDVAEKNVSCLATGCELARYAYFNPYEILENILSVKLVVSYLSEKRVAYYDALYFSKIKIEECKNQYSELFKNYFFEFENIIESLYAEKKRALISCFLAYIFTVGNAWCLSNGLHCVHQGATVCGTQPIDVTRLLIEYLNSPFKRLQGR